MIVKTSAWEVDGKIVLNEVTLWFEAEYSDFRQTFPSAKFLGFDELFKNSPYERWTLDGIYLHLRRK